MTRRMVLPFTPSEQTFLDILLDRGQIAPQLLTDDPLLQQRIATEPWLKWKALNVRTHLASAAPDPRDGAAHETPAELPST